MPASNPPVQPIIFITEAPGAETESHIRPERCEFSRNITMVKIKYPSGGKSVHANIFREIPVPFKMSSL